MHSHAVTHAVNCRSNRIPSASTEKTRELLYYLKTCDGCLECCVEILDLLVVALGLLELLLEIAVHIQLIEECVMLSLQCGQLTLG